MGADLHSAEVFASKAHAKPLIAIGSGGALSVAQVACTVHEYRSGCPSIAMTPLTFLRSPIRLDDTAVLCISASGKNPDILAAYDAAVSREPATLALLCGRPDSPLVSRAMEPWIDRLTYELPWSDGFLATHSVLAFSVLLARALSNGARQSNRLPKTLPSLLRGRSWASLRSQVAKKAEGLGKAATTLVLYSPLLRAASLDLESRCAEAALSNLWLSDFRNFGHGRHHWLAKRGSESSVLSLVAEEDADLLERTLDLLPCEVPLTSFVFNGGCVRAAIASLVITILLPETMGPHYGIDPAKPGVPLFGRKLYRLRPSVARVKYDLADRAVERKCGAPLVSLTSRSRRMWFDALNRYSERLRSSRFDVLVFDYDGTLCDVDDRFGSMPTDTAELVEKLLADGTPVAIATGRGSSLLDAIRSQIDERFWPQLTVGLKNCASIQTLDSPTPLWTAPASEELARWATTFAASSELKQLATVHPGESSISIRPVDAACFGNTQKLVRTMLQVGSTSMKLQESTHSVDVLPPGTSKAAILRYLHNTAGLSAPCAIGDRGDVNGNDFDLMHACMSLSVDRVSLAREHCWNLAPAGVRLRSATHYYLGRMRNLKSGFCRFALL